MSNRSFTMPVFLLLLSFAYGLASAKEQSVEVWALAWDDVSDLYREQPYEDGFVGQNGTVQRGGLGCNAYANAVLFQLRYGANWLQYWNDAITWERFDDETREDLRDRGALFNFQLHYGWGDALPEALGLKASYEKHAGTLLEPVQVRNQIDPGVYYFDVRADVQGELRGHVGFLLIDSDGNVRQSHFSGRGGADRGLKTGLLSRWLNDHPFGYDRSVFTLYKLPVER